MITLWDRVSYRTSMYICKAINAILFTLKWLLACEWLALIIREGTKTYALGIGYNQGIASLCSLVGASLHDNEWV